MKYIFILGLILSSQSIAQVGGDDDGDNSQRDSIEESRKQITNIYNTYNYDSHDESDVMFKAFLLSLLKNINNMSSSRPYGCVWSSMPVQLKDGRSIPFYQCK